MKQLSLIFLLFSAVIVNAQTVPTIPTKTNDFVNDYANILTDSEETLLRDLAYAIEKESSSQVVVVTTDDLDPDYPIEQFSIDLAETWGIGQKGVDNGVLILICPKNHQARIEVGYGLEGVLTDAYTRRIQEQHFKPNFRQNLFYTGISNVMLDIKDQISPEAQEQRRQLAVQREKEAKENQAAFLNFLTWFGIIGLLLALVGYAIYKAIAEQRRKEKERKDKEEAVRLEKERIIKAAENEERIFFELSDKVIKTFKRMDDNFYNAKELLLKVIKLQHDTKATLKDALYMDYANICRPVVEEIKKLSNDLLKKFEIKETIFSNSNFFNQNKDSLKTKITNAINTANRIKQDYNHKVWGNSEAAVDNFLNKNYDHLTAQTILLNHHNLAHISLTEALKLENNFAKFIEAEEHTKKAVSNYDYYINICQTIENVDKQIKDAITSLASFNATLTSKINEVVEYFRKHRSDISNRVRNEWENFIAKPKYQVNMRTGNPLQVLEESKKYLQEIEEFLNKAKKEVKAAQKKRDDEEEERQRRRRAAAAAAASYSSSRSSSSSFGGGGGSSFGGGSFGGGGSSSRW